MADMSVLETATSTTSPSFPLLEDLKVEQATPCMMQVICEVYVDFLPEAVWELFLHQVCSTIRYHIVSKVKVSYQTILYHNIEYPNIEIPHNEIPHHKIPHTIRYPTP